MASREQLTARGSHRSGRSGGGETHLPLWMQYCILERMHSTSVRIDRATHQELKRLASELGSTVGETVALAVRRLRQDRIGEELANPLSQDEIDWFDADLG